MMSLEETHLIVKEQSPAPPKLKGICRRLIALTALLLFLCLLIRSVSELTRRFAERNSVVYDDSWGCPKGRSTSFHDQLWCANLDLTNAAYKTEFIQGILKGKMAASVDEKFGVQRAYWQKKIAELYSKQCKQAHCNQQTNDFLLHASQLYASLANEQTHYRTNPPTKPDRITRDYVKYLKTVSKTYPAHYNAIVIVAHTRLWIELSQKLAKHGFKDKGDGLDGWILDTSQLVPVMNEGHSLLNAATSDFDETPTREIYRHVLHCMVDALETATA